VVRRRALLLGGGAALAAAGCGKDVRVEPPPPEPALLGALAAERALGTALTALELRGLAARSRARATRLASALSERGARPHDAPAPAGAAPLPAGDEALVAYVALLPTLRQDLAFGVDLLAEAAGDVALMGAAVGHPPDDPFPGTPT
jgi:hypothetical protein